MVKGTANVDRHDPQRYVVVRAPGRIRISNAFFEIEPARLIRFYDLEIDCPG
jgi:hypothetical protein